MEWKAEQRMWASVQVSAENVNISILPEEEKGPEKNKENTIVFL